MADFQFPIADCFRLEGSLKNHKAHEEYKGHKESEKTIRSGLCALGGHCVLCDENGSCGKAGGFHRALEVVWGEIENRKLDIIRFHTN